jgi:Cdc6-like AAA superfamily ATPase
MRYKIDECISAPTTSISVDPRLSALYKESTNLVGIQKQKDDLVKWVMEEEQQLKVMSIVGSDGLGKTTLANEVYREVRDQFNCNIFVSISQKPDMTRILCGILSQQLHLPPPSYACDVKDLIDILGEYLHDKRYQFLV